MSILPLFLAILCLVALTGIIWPFRPFRKRRNALFTLIAAFGLLAVIAPDPEPQSASALVRLPDTAPKAPQDAEVAALRQAVETGQWSSALEQLRTLERRGADSAPLVEELEDRLLALVRPLPAAEMQANLAGYELLSALRPDETHYVAKVDEYRAAIARSRSDAVALLQRNHDRIEGITWYQHPNRPQYTNSRSTVYLYIGQREGSRPWLRMKVQYAARDWLFVDRVVAWHDGVREDLHAGRFQRDNNTTIWEWADVTPTPYQLEVLRSLSEAREAILRFHGQKYHRDVTLSRSDKLALAEMLRAWEAMAPES
ncbi:MAG: hypothetical protein WCZ72_10830 [Gemmobacter sp.]